LSSLDAESFGKVAQSRSDRENEQRRVGNNAKQNIKHGIKRNSTSNPIDDSVKKFISINPHNNSHLVGVRQQNFTCTSAYPLRNPQTSSPESTSAASEHEEPRLATQRTPDEEGEV
jgi:hypothetical protein